MFVMGLVLILFILAIILIFVSPLAGIALIFAAGGILAWVMTKKGWWKQLFKEEPDDTPEVKTLKGCTIGLIIAAAFILILVILFLVYHFSRLNDLQLSAAI